MGRRNIQSEFEMALKRTQHRENNSVQGVNRPRSLKRYETQSQNSKSPNNSR